MKRKYIFFDIDGTLTDLATGKIVPSAQEAVNRLKAAGHFVSICTGRALYKAEAFRASHGFDHMVCNGGHGIILDGKVIENEPIDFEKAAAVYREARSLGFGVLVAIDDSKKVYAEDFRFIEQVGERQEPTVYVIDKEFDIEKAPAIFKMYISIPAEKESELTLLNTVGHLRFTPKYLFFQHDDKKRGILRMLELIGGDPEDVVVFGDDTNDLAMFDPRFFCVAMGNARDEELLRRADHIAPRNLDDGIYRTCEEMGWF